MTSATGRMSGLIPQPVHGIRLAPPGVGAQSAAGGGPLVYVLGSLSVLVLFAVVLAVTLPPLRARLVAAWKLRRRDRPLRDVVSLRDHYALQRIFEQVLLEPDRRRTDASQPGEARRSVLYVRRDTDVVHVEHSDGFVLRLVGVADAVARRLVEAVARHRVELLHRNGADVVFQVSPYGEGEHDGEILRVRAKQVHAD